MAPGENGVTGGEDCAQLTLLLRSSGLGRRQNCCASAAPSSSTLSVLQMAGTGFCQGTPKPRFSRAFGVMRADWVSSEMDLRFDGRRWCPSTEAGLQPAEEPEPQAPEGIISPGDTSVPAPPERLRELVLRASGPFTGEDP